MRKYLFTILLLLFTVQIGFAGDDNFNIFNANSLTGGGLSLDKIDSDLYLDTGDIALTGQPGEYIYFHVYDEDEIRSEDPPDIIVPDDNNSGSGAWVLTYMYQQSGGTKTVSIPLLDSETSLVSGNNFSNIYFFIPESLNGWSLTGVSVAVSTASISGKPTFQIHNVTDGTDLLTTRITIDEDEKHSADATISASVDTSNNSVVTGDQLRFDCDVSGNGTQGTQIDLIFTR